MSSEDSSSLEECGCAGEDVSLEDSPRDMRDLAFYLHTMYDGKRFNENITYFEKQRMMRVVHYYEECNIPCKERYEYLKHYILTREYKSREVSVMTMILRTFKSFFKLLIDEIDFMALDRIKVPVNNTVFEDYDDEEGQLVSQIECMQLDNNFMYDQVMVYAEDINLKNKIYVDKCPMIDSVTRIAAAYKDTFTPSGLQLIEEIDAEECVNCIQASDVSGSFFLRPLTDAIATKTSCFHIILRVNDTIDVLTARLVDKSSLGYVHERFVSKKLLAAREYVGQRRSLNYCRVKLIDDDIFFGIKVFSDSLRPYGLLRLMMEDISSEVRRKLYMHFYKMRNKWNICHFAAYVEEYLKKIPTRLKLSKNDEEYWKRMVIIGRGLVSRIWEPGVRETVARRLLERRPCVVECAARREKNIKRSKYKRKGTIWSYDCLSEENATDKIFLHFLREIENGTMLFTDSTKAMARRALNIIASMTNKDDERGEEVNSMKLLGLR